MSRRVSNPRRLMLVLFLNLALITAQVAVGAAAHSAELQPPVRCPVPEAGVRYIRVHNTWRTCASIAGIAVRRPK
jgi:hypothetical protein